uniref:Chromosome 2 open reading frame 72 n=1 Tax=Gopherus evgoodei TaxID=1825980 RepID=A0A8C4YKX1_9SAUR
MEGEPPGPGEQALQEFQALVELVGGKPEVLLVGEVLEVGETRALLGTFAQELFGEQPGPAAGSERQPGDQAAGGRETGGQPGDQVRVCIGPGGAGREIRSPLIFLLCRAGSLQPRRARARLREIARDLRSRLPRGPPPALVGVIVQPGPGEEAAAAALLETLLCEVFQGQRAGRQDTVQAAAYSPGRPDGTLEVRRAACRALRAALQHRAGTGRGEQAWGVGVFRAICSPRYLSRCPIPLAVSALGASSSADPACPPPQPAVSCR